MSDDPASVQAFQDELRTMQKLAVRLDRYERFFCAALTGRIADQRCTEATRADWIKDSLKLADLMETEFEKHWNEKMFWEERRKNAKR